MRPTFIKKIHIAVTAAAAAVSICGCAAGGALTAGTTEAPWEEAGTSDPGKILPDRIEIKTDRDYPYDAEEIMYLSGVRSTAYRQNTTYSRYDLDGDGLSELIIAVADSGAETTGIYAYDADQKAAVLELGEDRFSVLPRIFHNSDPEEVEAVRQDFEIPVRHLLSKAGWPEEDIDRLLKESFGRNGHRPEDRRDI